MKEKVSQFVEEHKEAVKTCKNWILGCLVGAGVTMIIVSDYGESKYNAGYTKGARRGILAGIDMATSYNAIKDKESSDNKN